MTSLRQWIEVTLSLQTIPKLSILLITKRWWPDLITLLRPVIFWFSKPFRKICFIHRLSIDTNMFSFSCYFLFYLFWSGTWLPRGQPLAPTRDITLLTRCWSLSILTGPTRGSPGASQNGCVSEAGWASSKPWTNNFTVSSATP